MRFMWQACCIHPRPIRGLQGSFACFTVNMRAVMFASCWNHDSCKWSAGHTCAGPTELLMNDSPFFRTMASRKTILLIRSAACRRHPCCTPSFASLKCQSQNAESGAVASFPKNTGRTIQQ